MATDARAQRAAEAIAEIQMTDTASFVSQAAAIIERECFGEARQSETGERWDADMGKRHSRDRFVAACAAMTGLLANPNNKHDRHWPGTLTDQIVQGSVVLADALLAALAMTEQK